MDEDGSHGRKGHGVGQGELGRQIQGRVLLVGGLVELVVGVENAFDIVLVAPVVERLQGLDGDVLGIQRAAEVDAHGDEDKKEEDASENVGDGVERGDEGRANVSADDGPVKGNGHQAVAMLRAEDLVDDDVVGRDPADPGEDGQALEDPARKPVVAEGAAADDEEELVAADRPPVGL